MVSLLLAVALLMSLTVSASATVASETLDAAIEGSAAYICQTVKAPQVGSIGGEWAVLGLARSGCSVPEPYYQEYYATVEQYVATCKGVLHEKKYTEYSRVIVALTAIGKDPTSVAGYNLLTPLGDFDKTVWQGINGPIWALIALDSADYAMPQNPAAAEQATRQRYLDEILRRQLSDGGWNLTDEGGAGKADPDITGMALQALANYQSQPAVKTATDKALGCLSVTQDSDGGYASWGPANSESVVQVIVALCELGVPLDDARFVKNGKTLLDHLLSYRNADGSFRHTGSGSNQMATEQGFYGIVAAQRAQSGKSSLYRMSDAIRIGEGAGQISGAGLPGKHADVKSVPITALGATFDDISASASRPAIEALAARQIINGKESERFEPDATMTRAEFATIVVKALGLAPEASSRFTDVKNSDWFAPYVGAANRYGIVNGTTEATFAPMGTITRQEAAVMVVRAAELCGMDTQLNAAAVRDVLAQFSDYVRTADWARPSLAFCCQEEILDTSALDIRPTAAILRGEIAQMLFNLLGKANLL